MLYQMSRITSPSFTLWLWLVVAVQIPKQGRTNYDF
jgi:hypothetical protein